mgnify:CR=1 FL=1
MADQQEAVPTTTSPQYESKTENQGKTYISMHVMLPAPVFCAGDLAAFLESNASARARYAKATAASKQKLAKLPDQVRAGVMFIVS